MLSAPRLAHPQAPVDKVAIPDLVDAATALSTFVSQVNTLGKPANPSTELSGGNLEQQKPQVVSDSESYSNEKSSVQGKDFFPRRLMALLADESLSDIITWLPNGRSFAIMKADAFVEQVLPKYFGTPASRASTKYQSFTRKLNRWGFRQLTKGSEAGAFYNPLFQRDSPDLCLNMVCISRRGTKATQKPHWTFPVGEILPTQVKTNVTEANNNNITGLSNANYPCSSSGSVISTNSTSSSGASASSATDQMRVIKVLSQDKNLLAEALKKRDEAERLRIARAMLYTAFLKAL